MTSAWWSQLFLQLFLLLVCCRHIISKTPGPTPPPLAPISPLPTDVRSVVLKGESHTERVELLSPVSLDLQCTWTGKNHKAPHLTGLWRKDGAEVESSRVTVQLENEQYNLRRVFSIVSEEDLGSYSCVFGSEAKIDFVLAGPQIGQVRDKPIVSYVGDSAVISCRMDDSKPKPSSWNWYKDNGTDKDQIFDAAESLRYEIKNEARKTKLVVRNLTEADGGFYYCGAVYAISTTIGHVQLKVINFHEPLKPFIAIVIEVLVLVAAILLYERSQAKKKHTAGNGPTDQSNTLPQEDSNGPEESSAMRQRKV